MIKVKLSKTIEAHGEQVKSLELREPNLGDLIEMEKAGEGEMAQLAKLIEVLAGIPASAVKSIAPVDIKTIADAVVPFLDSPKET